MHNLNIYRDGSLPALQQDFRPPSLKVLRCSYWEITAWSHTNLSSPYWRLYWNREPGAFVAWRDERYALLPDRLILISPNTPFTSSLENAAADQHESNILVGRPYHPGNKKRPSGMVHHFFTHFTLGQPHDSVRSFILTIDLGGDLLEIVERITQALGEDRHQLDYRNSLSLQTLILYALTRLPEDTWPERLLDHRLLNVLAYLDEHLGDPLRNEDLGRVAGMSPNGLTRLFRLKTGRTPLAYLNQRRIEEASILLHHTDHSIEQIAEECGFSDRHYFTRVFRKQLGVGPATFRRHRA